ncbi:hypothetical protein [Bacteroides sp. 519]|uniref:hypothetical protein n=1 Tax=Bacteroides sp. 519 TaxID=2302937 RepID=UPI0013D3B24E|nr:hypothetical protein [Bacteroides sp. 519]NDV60105.1 hypothetical protein [Bacteroides sp. 519]
MTKTRIILKTVKYRDWTFEVDFEFTKKSYTKFKNGGASDCECADCKNFTYNRHNAYPEEIKLLFAELGVDYTKESEVMHYCQEENGLHYYAGWFHFKGKMLSGKDCRISHTETTHTFELERITKNFSIGFTLGNSPSLFENLDGLIQIEFETKIP